jgi:hypothetical protein
MCAEARTRHGIVMDEIILGWPATRAVRDVLAGLQPPIELDSLVVTTCDTCRAVVWIGPRQAALRVVMGQGVRVRCVPCVIKLAPVPAWQEPGT